MCQESKTNRGNSRPPLPSPSASALCANHRGPENPLNKLGTFVLLIVLVIDFPTGRILEKGYSKLGNRGTQIWKI
jgi:hypothetical protein